MSKNKIREENLTEAELATFFDGLLEYRILFPVNLQKAITRIVHKHRKGFRGFLGWFVVGLNGGHPVPADTINVCKFLRNNLKIKPSTILDDPASAVKELYEWKHFHSKDNRILNRLGNQPDELVMEEDLAEIQEEEVKVDTVSSEPETTEPQAPAILRKNSFVRTFSNSDVDLLDPDPESIRIEDIAHHLSQLIRYNGAGAYPYSVAQHSIYCARLAEPLNYGLEALFHDSPEAYTGDMVSPLKKLIPNFDELRHRIIGTLCPNEKMQPAMLGLFGDMGELFPTFRDIEDRLAKAIAKKFNLTHPRPQLVKDIDISVMAAEMNQVVHWPDLAALLTEPPADIRISYKPWHQVRDEFISCYYELAEKKKQATLFQVEVNNDNVSDSRDQVAA